MSPSEDLLRFIGSSFRSVWALELLLLLKSDPRPWPAEELVATLRASELVVSNALGALVAAGLATVEEDGAIYQPTSDAVASCVDQLQSLYALRPDAVRREIVKAQSGGAAAFAEAFRLRKD